MELSEMIHNFNPRTEFEDIVLINRTLSSIDFSGRFQFEIFAFGVQTCATWHDWISEAGLN